MPRSARMLLFLSSLIACEPSSGNGPDGPCEHAFYADADGDGHGNATVWTTSCETPAGYVATAGDCDDTSDAVHPGAHELCNALDDDCNGSVDVGAIDAGVWFADRDGDGFGDDATETASCVPPAMHIDVAGDCDDASDAIHPGAPETCDDLDDDCDGLVDAIDGDLVDGTTWYADADGDMYGDPGAAVVDCVHPEGTVADGTDCDDLHANIHPDVTELCDGIDDDCDGLTDDDDPVGLVGTHVYYADGDADGLGDAMSTTDACVLPTGFAENDDDCDDADGSVGGPTDWYDDGDHDGYGERLYSLCEGGIGWSAIGGDCDDRDAAISPGAAETCDDMDNNCDGLVDDDDPLVEGTAWYADDDRDGYGDDSSAVSSCAPVPDYISEGGDCDPASADVYPGAPEQCDSLDNDCDGSVDESVVYSDWYRDDDGDGYGTSLDDVNDCVRPSGYAAIAGDCDDLVATTSPGAEEVCANDADDDCDGSADDCTLGLPDACAEIEGSGPDWSSTYAVGQAVAVGDLDGDGTADLLVGDLTNTTAYIVYGPLSGRTSVADGAAITTTVLSGWFGAEIEAGDLDGDGASDAVVGDYWNDTVYAFLGPITGATETADADAVYVGTTHDPDDLAVLGDVDGDGVPDLAIGSEWAYCTIDGRSTSHCGAAYVVSGASSGAVDLTTDATYAFLATAEDALGIATVSMGDVTSDGIDDFAIGAELAGTSQEGTVYLVAGGAESGSYDPAVVAFGQITSALDERRELDAILASADYDDDGHADLFVGAPQAGSDNAGAVYLFYGPLSGDTTTTDASVRWEATEHDAALGSSVSVGDVDADGERDVLMAGASPGRTPGGAWLQIGKASGVIDVATLPSFEGSADDKFGSWSGLVPDWNGDLGDEIAVGAPGWEDASGHSVGKIWVFSSGAF